MFNCILSEIRNGIGILTLNSEKTLNALSLPMIESLYATLLKWKEDSDIHAVFLQGAGEKAFCAGGDVVRLQEAIVQQAYNNPDKPAPDCVRFFTKEYQLDFEIHQYPKPILVWADGIVMGGGLGLLAGASHRIVTEKSKMAMPEVTIGLYPDVGATWFLNQMPSAWGLYLGLTATRFNAADCLYLQLADYYISSALKSQLLHRLDAIDWTLNENDSHYTITAVLQSLTDPSLKADSICKTHRGFIKSFEAVTTVFEFQEILLAAENTDPWIAAGVKAFKAGSPSAIHVIFEQLKHGKNWDLKAVFQSELNLSVQCTLHPDFPEGVRALLIDKDQTPKWHPNSLENVTQEWVNSYFEPLWSDDKHPLNHL